MNKELIKFNQIIHYFKNKKFVFEDFTMYYLTARETRIVHDEEAFFSILLDLIQDKFDEDKYMDLVSKTLYLQILEFPYLELEITLLEKHLEVSLKLINRVNEENLRRETYHISSDELHKNTLLLYLMERNLQNEKNIIYDIVIKDSLIKNLKTYFDTFTCLMKSI